MFRWFLILLMNAGIVLSAFSTAQVYADEAAMTALLKRLATFTVYQARFSQESVDDRGDSMQQLTGTLLIKRPDRFLWQADEPAAQRLISDGETIWHLDEDLAQVVVQKYAQQRHQSPLLVILEDAVKLRSDYTAIEIEADGIQTEKKSTPLAAIYQLQAKSKDNPVKHISLQFNERALVSLTFTDALQQLTQVTFSDIQLDIHVDDGVFDFVIPDDVDVLYE